MPYHTRLSSFLLAAGLVACSTPAPLPAPAPVSVDPHDPDPSVRFVVKPHPRFVPNPELATPPGPSQVFDVEGTSNHISLFFVPRSAEAHHRDLANYVVHANAEFEQVVTDRDIRPLEITAERNPIRAAGLPFRAFTFVTVQKPGAPPPTSICDAGGMFIETPGGFWTLSWNSDRGRLLAETPVLEEFLGALQVVKKG